jgi:hypothetical protein
MVPNLRPGIALATHEHTRHDILGQRRCHLACVEMVHAQQAHQGDIQRHLPGEARATIDVVACCGPPSGHHLEKRRPWQGALELE